LREAEIKTVVETFNAKLPKYGTKACGRVRMPRPVTA
jgi:hypothetical protein